ncbi:MAG: serine/threonine protein kinase [Sandaracinaceae bacterium]|nr:serine/threonine protein kinase [Sandaracinaceae bacterium]
MSPNEPVRFGEYRLLEKLGQGGMAVVYRGERVGEAGFKKKVALKRMLPQFRREPSLLERFAAEARTNARLDHPNLVHVVDFGIEPEPYLVMEFVEGVTLAALMHRLHKRREKLEIAAACFIGAEAAQGLDHAHRKRDENGKPLGIVHRDVSPQNILLSNEGAVKVSDFGLVKAADNVVQTGSGIPVGKMSYMAPEQAEHADIDARADVFSLGVVVWEMLTLRPMLPQDDPARATYLLRTSEFPPPSKYNDKVSPELDHIVMSCLVRDPKQRTPSAQALAMQLRELVHELAPGYGREQLARLVGWAFPERGWQMDEPHETAAQPTLQDRMSMPNNAVTTGQHPAIITGAHPAQPAPQAVILQAGGQALLQNAAVAAAQAVRTSSLPPPPAKSTWWIWAFLIGGGGLALLLLLFFIMVFAFSSKDGDEAPAPSPMQPLPPTVTAAAAGVMIETNVESARVFIGPRELGFAPVQLRASDLNGYPLVVVARGHSPSIVTPDRLAALLSTSQGGTRVELVPSRRPDQAVFVDVASPGIARLPLARDSLGPVPGIVIVPPTFGRPTASIDVVALDGAMHVISLVGCNHDKVCVVGR